MSNSPRASAAEDFTTLNLDVDSRLAQLQDQRQQDTARLGQLATGFGELSSGMNDLRQLVQQLVRSMPLSLATPATTGSVAASAPPSQAPLASTSEADLAFTTRSVPAPSALVFATSVGADPFAPNSLPAPHPAISRPSLSSQHGLINQEFTTPRTGQVSFYSPATQMHSDPSAPLYTNSDWSPAQSRSSSPAPTHYQRPQGSVTQMPSSKSTVNLARAGSLDAAGRATESCREFFQEFDPCQVVKPIELEPRQVATIERVISFFSSNPLPAGVKYGRNAAVAPGFSAAEHIRALKDPLAQEVVDEGLRGLAILVTLPQDRRELWTFTHDELLRRALYYCKCGTESRRQSMRIPNLLPSWPALVAHFLRVMSPADSVLAPYMTADEFRMVPGSNPMVFQHEWLRLHMLAGYTNESLLDDACHIIAYRDAIPADDWKEIYRLMSRYVRDGTGFRKTDEAYKWCLRHVHEVHIALFDERSHEHRDFRSSTAAVSRSRDSSLPPRPRDNSQQPASQQRPPHLSSGTERRGPPVQDRCTLHPDSYHTNADCRSQQGAPRGPAPAPATGNRPLPVNPSNPAPARPAASSAAPAANRGPQAPIRAFGSVVLSLNDPDDDDDIDLVMRSFELTDAAPSPQFETASASLTGSSAAPAVPDDGDELVMRAFEFADAVPSPQFETASASLTGPSAVPAVPDEGGNGIEAPVLSPQFETVPTCLTGSLAAQADTDDGEERLVRPELPSNSWFADSSWSSQFDSVGQDCSNAPRSTRRVLTINGQDVSRVPTTAPYRLQRAKRPIMKVPRKRHGPYAHADTRRAMAQYPDAPRDRRTITFDRVPDNEFKQDLYLAGDRPFIPTRSLQATGSSSRRTRPVDEVVQSDSALITPWNPDDPAQAAELIEQPEVDDAPRVPVTLVNTNTKFAIQLHDAVWDTGAARSMITAQTCRLINLPFREVANQRLSVPNGTAAKLVTEYPVQVYIGTKIYRMNFLVDSSNRHTLIGQDLIRVLGGPQAKWPYEFAHVPGFFEKEAAGAIAAPVEPPPSDVPVSANHKEIVEWATAQLEANNARIASGGRCTHPAAIVHVVHQPGTKPSFRHQYPYADKFVPLVDIKIAQMLLDGTIIPLVSYPPLYCMPLLPLPKVVDALGNVLDIRLTVDARGINVGLEFTPYPLPDMRELLRRLPGVLFTELDLQSFFNQMPVHPDSQHKLVIKHRGKYYQFTVAPFGLASLPAQAQMLMHAVLQHCPHTAAYIDNVTTGTEDSAAAHIAALKPVFDALLHWNLRLTIPKAKIAHLRLAALGYQREGNTVSLADDKKEAVRAWPTPDSKDSLARFLGFTCFLRDHIFDYSAKTRLLDKIKAAAQFVWTEEAQHCFDALKEEIYHNALVLKVFDADKPTYLITDASTVGIAGILYQPEPADNELPTATNVVYLCSRAARGAEQAYPAYKAELNAGRYAMSKFKLYLYGRRFVWLTDHRSLTFMTAASELNRNLLSWREEFAQYVFDVRHVEGAANIMADALSRCYPDRFRATVAMRAVLSEPESDEQCQFRLARLAHIWGHFGVRPTLERLHHQGHQWPGMETTVRTVIDNCNACRQWSLGLQRFSPISSPTANQPWAHIAFDPVEMPLANGFKTLVVIVDQFTGYVLLRASPDKSARKLAAILWQVIADFGPPSCIHSDGEATNIATVLTALRSIHGVEHETITAYNPQQNGKAEAAVKTTLTLVRKMLIESSTLWPEILGSAQLMMNTKTRSLTRIDPFRLMFGRAAIDFDMVAPIGPDTTGADALDDYQQWLATLQATTTELWPGRLELVRAEQARISKYFNDRHRVAKVPLPAGAWVMCRNTTRASKQEAPFEGPFKIADFDERTKSYTVVDAADEQSKRQVPMAHLKPIIYYRHNQNSEATYHIEEILDHRITDGKDEFLIKWYGFPTEEASWVERANMNGQKAILQFLKSRREQPNNAAPSSKKTRTRKASRK